MFQIDTLQAHEASEIFMAIALFVATILVLRYTQKRVAGLPAEEKAIGRPLYLTGFALFVLGLASVAYVSHHLFEPEVAGILGPILQTYWFLAILGAGMLAIAAMMILGWNQYIAFPLTAVLLGGVFALLGNVMGIDVGIVPTAGANATIIGVIALFLFALPMFLFGFLAYRTKSATVAAIAFMTPLYAIWPVAMAPLDLYVAGTIWELLLTFVRLLGPAVVVVAYYLPNIKISGELFGYATAYSAMAMWFSVFLSPYLVIGGAVLVADPIELLLLSSHGFIAAFGLATGSYVYSRWSVTRNPATLGLMLYFFIGPIDYLTHSLEEHGTSIGIAGDYFSLIMSLLAPMFLAIGALIALDWKRIMLLPTLLIMPALIYLVTGFPFDPHNLPQIDLVMVATDAIQLALPAIMYSLIWWRARKLKARGRSRALFLVLGIIGMIVTTVIIPVFLTGGLLELVIIPYVLFWIGITGRADKLLKTAT